MEEDKKKEGTKKTNKEQHFEKNTKTGLEGEKLSKTVQVADTGNISKNRANEKANQALNLCYKLIEKIANDYIPVNADSAKKNRLIGRLKANAEIDFRKRLEIEGIENIEKIIQDTAGDVIKPIVPVEDKGKRPVSKEEKRQASINNYIEKNFYESLEKSDNNNTNVMSRISNDVKKLGGDSKSRTKWENAYLFRDAIKLAEMAKAGDQTALKQLNEMDSVLGYNITTTDENGNISINQENFDNLVDKHANNIGMKPEEFYNDAAQELNVEKEFYDKHPELSGQETLTQEEIDKLIESMNAEKSITEQFSDIFSKDSKEFNEEIYALVEKDPIGAQNYLKEFLSNPDNMSISGFQDKIMFMQESIKQAEKEKLKEAFGKDDGTFKEEVTELVKLNPTVAQEFLKEFIANPENCNIKNYDLKVMTLQENIIQTMSERTTGKETSKDEKKGDFLNVEEIDMSKLVKETGASILEGKPNEVEKSQDDDERDM